MAYEPEQRYLRDLPTRHQVNAPFDEQPSTDRGQFWAVSNHMRSRWARGGASFGLTFAAIYLLLDGDVPLPRIGHLASTMLFIVACALGGGVIGFVASFIRRRFSGEA